MQAQKKLTGRIIKFEEVTTEKNDTLRCIHFKISSTSAIKLWFSETNLFFSRFSAEDEGKRFEMTVTEEANGKGGLKYKLIESVELDDKADDPEETKSENSPF